MDLLGCGVLTRGPTPGPAQRTSKRSRSHSPETTCPRKRNSVIDLVADAPARRLPFALPVALLIAISVYFAESQFQFVQKIATGGQYVVTTLVKTDALVDLTLGHTDCVSERPRATSAQLCSAHGNRVASRVMEGSSPERGVSVLAQRNPPKPDGALRREELHGSAAKFVGTCDTGISAH